MFLAFFAANAWGGDKTSTLTFTSACSGSGTANDGVTWTVTSDASETTFDSSKGIHYGSSSKAVSYLTLTSASFDKRIKKVVVNCSDANKTAMVSVKVGGNAFGTSLQETAYNNSAYTFEPTTEQSATVYKGVIVVSLNRTSAKKALYVKSIAVTYEDSDEPTKTLSSIAVSGTPTKTTYTEGDTFDPAGLVVTGTYSDESTAEITDGITWSFDPETLALGTTSVDVTATVGGLSSEPYSVSVSVEAFVVTAGTYTIGFNNELFGVEGTGNEDGEHNATVNGVAIVTGNLSSASSKTYFGTNHVRFYQDNYLKVSVPEGYLITNIVFTADGTWNGSITSSPEGYDNSKKTWTGSSKEVDFNFGLQNRISKMTVTFVSAEDAPDPVISNFIKTSSINLQVGDDAYDVRECLNIPDDYDTSVYSITTTINGLTEKDGEYACVYPYLSFQKAGTYTVHVVAAAIKGKYAQTEGDITVNVSEPISDALTTCDEVYAAACKVGERDGEQGEHGESAVLTFDNWVVTGVKTSGTQVYVTDGTKGFILYGKESGFEVGDVISGTANVRVSLYNGAPDVEDVKANTEGITVTKNGTITPVVVTEELTAVNTGSVVTLNEVVYDATAKTFSDGVNTIKYYNALMEEGLTFIDGRKYNVTGVFLWYGDTGEFLPRSAEDVVLLPAETYTVNWSVNGEITKTETVEEGSAATAPAVTVPDGYTQKFMGWVTTETVDAETAPAYVTSFDANADITYYAVFADEVGGSGSGDYKRVTAALTDWSGDYLIAYDAGEANNAKDDYFADGSVCGKDGIGKSSGHKTPSSNDWVDNNTIKATWGDTYNVTLVPVEGGYVMQTKDGNYNYQTSNSNGLVSTENITTADDHPITVNFVSEGDVQLIVEGGAVFHYNTTTGTNGQMFRFYKNGGQAAVYLYKKSGGSTYSGFTTLLQRETISIAAKAYDEGKTNKYYGTYYSANNLVVGEDMTCAVVGVNEDKTKIVVNTFEAGDIIPANTGFMVSSDESGDHYMAVTKATPSELPGSNLLRGSIESATTTGPDEEVTYLFYKLTFHDGKDLGFWWGADNGAAFQNGAHKAYLAVPQDVAMQVRGFAFGDMETAISTVTTAESTAPLYDLQGRRISAPQHGGLYIQGGKKYIK